MNFNWASWSFPHLRIALILSSWEPFSRYQTPNLEGLVYWITYIAILLFGVAILVGTMVGSRRIWPDANSSKRNLVENISLALLALFLTFMAAEAFFAFFAQTDGRNYTLASKNWFKRYWVVNPLGFRDVEWTPAVLADKRKVVVLGDSFATGVGIENVEDRFSNILGKELADHFVVMNMGVNGASTKDELETVKKVPYKPETVVLQYYINDIEATAKERNVRYTVPKSSPWPIFQPLIDNSYALNFIYWRSAALGPRTWNEDYLSWLKRVYDDPDIWWLHQQELLALYQGAISEQVQLVVVVFPALTDIQSSREITAKVIDFFTERGVPVLDVAELVEGEPTRRLVVNKFDAHPSAWVHRRVADRLAEMIIQLNEATPSGE